MSEVFAYEVTRSSDVAVRVGSCLIDVEHEGGPVRTWLLWNSKTGDFSGGWTATRRDRLCATCYGWRGVRFIRLDAHEGDHGPGEQFVPEWIVKREAEIAEVEPSGSTVTKWFCRSSAGWEFEWPTEEVARGHVTEQGCALVKKTISIATVLSQTVVETGPKPLTAEEFGGIETPHGRIFESAGGTWVAYGHLSEAVFRESFNWVDPEVRGDPILAEEAIDIDHRWATLHQDVNDADDEWEIRWHATTGPEAPGAFPVTVLL